MDKVGAKSSGPDLDFEDYDNTKAGWANRWTAEFAYAKEFHRKWQTKGKEVITRFLMQDVKSNDPQAPGFNLGLFWSNITSMQSMLYGRIPKVSVDRRWADSEDQVARVASEIATRILNADIEEAGEDFSTILKACLQDRLLPGLGCARVRYEIDEDEAGEDITDERIEDVYVPWADILWSPARFWKEVRWVAFRCYKTKKELRKMLGKDYDLTNIPFNSKSPLEQLSAKSSAVWNKAEVWEIWSKEFKYCFWYIQGFPEILKSCEDPLQLDGFFPCPPFFIANTTTFEYCPKADYTFAETLYKEIDNLEERISLLTKAVKVVGVYDKKAGPDIGRMINETAENKLIPVDSWAVFQERGGIKGSIEFLPMEEIVLCIEKLQVQQQNRMTQLNMITGQSDIMRGAAKDEQVGNNQLNARFASIRVQAVQDEFTRFATDLQKLRLCIISKHFNVETILARSNMALTFDKDLALKAAQFLKDTESNKWRIMISPESMAMVDYSQLRQERTEYINSLGIFLQSSFPIAEKFPQATPILLQLLKWGLAGFKGSKEIEGVIEQVVAEMQKAAQNPQPPKQDPKAQAELQKLQMEMQQDQAQHQAKMQEQAAKHQTDMAKLITGFQIEMKELMARIQERGHDAHATVTENLSKPQPPQPLNLGQPAPPPQPQVSAPPTGMPNV